MREMTKWHSLVWYDGSHLSIRGDRRDKDDPFTICEVETWASTIEGVQPVEPKKVVVRLTLAELEEMVNLLEGRAVYDELNHGESEIPAWLDALDFEED